MFVFVFYECLEITGPRISGTPYRLIADATLASRIGRPSPPGAPARGREARSFRSRRDPDTRYRYRSRIRDAPVDTVPAGPETSGRRGAPLSRKCGNPSLAIPRNLRSEIPRKARMMAMVIAMRRRHSLEAFEPPKPSPESGALIPHGQLPTPPKPKTNPNPKPVVRHYATPALRLAKPQ